MVLNVPTVVPVELFSATVLLLNEMSVGVSLTLLIVIGITLSLVNPPKSLTCTLIEYESLVSLSNVTVVVNSPVTPSKMKESLLSPPVPLTKLHVNTSPTSGSVAVNVVNISPTVLFSSTPIDDG